MRLCWFWRVNKWNGGQQTTVGRGQDKRKTVRTTHLVGDEASRDQSGFFPSRLKTLTVPVLSI